MPLFLGNLVVAVLLAADVRLGGREPGASVDMERAKRVGNRRSGDFRGLAFAAFGRPGSVSDLLGAVGIVNILARIQFAPKVSSAWKDEIRLV